MSIEKRGKFNISKVLKEFRQTKRTMPKILGNRALNFFLDSYRKGGFTDRGFVRWDPRFKRLSRTRSSRVEREKATLIKSGRQRASMQVRRATFKLISVGTKGVRYARRHNEGLKGMPQRKFMGNSRKLDKILEVRIKKEVDKVWKVKP